MSARKKFPFSWTRITSAVLICLVLTSSLFISIASAQSYRAPYKQVALVAPFEDSVLQSIDYDASSIISYAYGSKGAINLNPGQYHLGVDYQDRGSVINLGMNVVAIADGCRVSDPGRAWFDYDGKGWGNRVWLKHNNQLFSTYNHLDQIFIKTGQCVYLGQPVGTLGQTGRVDGWHLHLDTPSHHPQDFIYWYDEDKYLDPNNVLGHTITIDLPEWVEPIDQTKPSVNNSSAPLTAMPIRQEFMDYIGSTDPLTAYAIYDIATLYGPKGQACVRNVLRTFAWPASGYNLSMVKTDDVNVPSFSVNDNYLKNHAGAWPITYNAITQTEKVQAGTGANSVDLYFGTGQWGEAQGMEFVWNYYGDCACYAGSIIRDALWNLGLETQSTSEDHTLNGYGWINVAGVPIVLSNGENFNEGVVYYASNGKGGGYFDSDIWAVSSINTTLYWMVADGKIIFWREGQTPPSGVENLPAPKQGQNQVTSANTAQTDSRPLPAITENYIPGEVIFEIPIIESLPSDALIIPPKPGFWDKYTAVNPDGTYTTAIVDIFSDFIWVPIIVVLFSIIPALWKPIKHKRRRQE